MTTLFSMKILAYFGSVLSGFSSNPVKLSVLLVLFSSLSFSIAYLDTSSLWFPLVFFLIFMGGILMMFMILSSTLPNEKSKKISMSSVIILCATLPMALSSTMKSQESFFKEAKSIVESNYTTQLATSLMLVYFVASIYMVSKEELPLRSLSMCY